MNKITASFKSGENEVAGVPVVNPGDRWGKAWLITVADCAFPSQFIVEADCAGDAQDEFIESDYGKSCRIGEDELKDYGFPVSKGDIIGGKEVLVDGWMRLDGEWQPEQDGLIENNYMSGNGILADTSSIQIDGREGWDIKCPFPCLYHGEGIPDGGLTPLQFSEWGDMAEEVKKLICDLPGGLSYPTRHGILRTMTVAWETAFEAGRSAGWDRCHDFYREEYGDPFLMLLLLRDVQRHLDAQQTISEGEREMASRAWEFVRKARTFRNAQCRLERTPDGGFLYKWFGSVPVSVWTDIKEIPKNLEDGTILFTFERMLEDRAEKEGSK